MTAARNKIKHLEELTDICKALHARSSRIVFTNGCFDLMHVGHLRYLEAARELGDVLIVGVNSDSSVRTIKGPERPIVEQSARGEMVAGLHCVDFVTFFDEPDPLAVIETLEPDVLVKGADWPLDKIIGAAFVQARGGKVVRVPLIPDISTTAIINRIAASMNR